MIRSRTADTFTIEITIRKDLVFSVECKELNGKWNVEKVVADPAGAGTPGPLQIKSSVVEVSEGKINIAYETPNQFEQGTNKESYKFTPVK